MSAKIIRAVENAINRLVDDFLANPWLHRVEHSLHCELYGLMRAAPDIPKTVVTAAFTTQPVHKEWPEPQSHGHRKRRGNFDLAVLQPALGDYEIDDFRYGRLPLLAAIEIGLNYSVDHLMSDWEKLRQSKVPHCHLVHLATPRCRSQRGVPEAVERVMKLENTGGSVQIAYADHKSGLWRILGERRVNKITTSHLARTVIVPPQAPCS
ncbi:MAG: hypothetical protein EB141_02100 [Verrucomicrobia bacterium]|nr:hypothetical protein [Verrucomicrobiota bacterium]NBU10419.1 hypothetical protein [Pseudomonadota bacterium]NDA65638.1 hypothetical protein [Verrucomicrobiota bacterium]NDB74437.1 hypothetical protein [Verrucomicrobiota bacterium]NDD37517.1 hypothetical protein [Verrucomicrobiota bacterium]